MTMFLFYNRMQDAQKALDAIHANMFALATEHGYEVVDGVVLGKVDGETDPDASGTERWAEIIEADLTGIITPGHVMYGFVDPVTLRPDLGPAYMAGVPPGRLIDYTAPVLPDEAT